MSTFEEQEQALSKSREELINEIKDSHEYVFDLEKAPKVKHHWSQYGIRFICSGAGHPRHEAFGRKPMAKR